MKNVLKILAAAMALMLPLAFLASCGGNTAQPGDTNAPAGTDTPAGTDAPAADEVKGAMDEHGYYKVFVPEGYTLKHEDVFGDVDPEAFNLNYDESSFTYFMFHMYSEDNAKSSVETTKELNDGTSDVTLETNGVKWTGVAYESYGIACFQLYADFDGHFVLVSGAGNAYDSAIVKTVLGSLEVNVTE